MYLEHWLIIYFRKILTLLLWEMKKIVKILIVFFSFPVKNFFIKTLIISCKTKLNVKSNFFQSCRIFGSWIIWWHVYVKTILLSN